MHQNYKLLHNKTKCSTDLGFALLAADCLLSHECKNGIMYFSANTSGRLEYADHVGLLVCGAVLCPGSGQVVARDLAATQNDALLVLLVTLAERPHFTTGASVHRAKVGATFGFRARLPLCDICVDLLCQEGNVVRFNVVF